MRKNAFFIGQPIFSQLLNLIPKKIIDQVVQKYDSDRYVKKFKTYDHLVSMLYCCFSKCDSLREVVHGLQISHYKLNHLGLSHTPRRSTISDANKRRSHEIFESIFHSLVKHYFPVLSDSRKARTIEDKLFLMDSTTVTLFSDIMKGAGAYKNNGRKKGGAKAHVLLKAKEDVPVFVHITESREHDLVFMSLAPLPKGSFIIFDKAYTNSKVLHSWDENEITWVTRLKKGAKIVSLSHLKIDQKERSKGILNDQLVKTGRRSNKSTKEMLIRLITYYDFEKKRIFKFITNNFELPAFQVTQLYKRRWQIELMFKRWKSTNPLKYFIGNNENAIKIQMWCALISDLLTQVIRLRLRKARANWSFSNLSGLLRQHLFTYVKLFDFLKKPERALLQYSRRKLNENQLNLFNSS